MAETAGANFRRWQEEKRGIDPDVLDDLGETHARTPEEQEAHGRAIAELLGSRAAGQEAALPKTKKRSARTNRNSFQPDHDRDFDIPTGFTPITEAERQLAHEGAERAREALRQAQKQ